MKIEVEVRNLDEIDQALAADVDRIMLDNFSIERTREAVKHILANQKGRHVEIESSGGITYDTLRGYGECGVDFAFDVEVVVEDGVEILSQEIDAFFL